MVSTTTDAMTDVTYGPQSELEFDGEPSRVVADETFDDLATRPVDATPVQEEAYPKQEDGVGEDI